MASSSIVALMFLRGRERIRARPLEDADRDRRVAIEIGIGRIVLRGELDRAMSFIRTTALAVCLTTMLPNSSVLVRRPSVCTEIWNAPGLSIGGWLSTPEATCTFCPASAVTTSFAVRPSDCRRSGSSQTRIA